MLGSLKRIARLTSRTKGRRPRVEPLERRDLLATFTVSSAADSGPNTLRDAITRSNLDTTDDLDQIRFSIGTNTGTTPQTIALQSPLPEIRGRVTINGLTQIPGLIESGAPPIIIDGANAGAGANGLNLTGPGGSTVRGLSIVNFRATTNGQGGRAILVNDAGGNTFTENYLGVAPDGTTARGNAVGIELRSANNIVGTVGVQPAGFGPNLISGNTSDGVLLSGSRASANRVVSNRIGTDISGTQSIGNLHGVTIASASGNFIGVADAGGNLISGNVGPDFTSGIGIYVTGASSGNSIAGNLIGTNLAGSQVLSNVYGIYFGTVGGSPTDSVTQTSVGLATPGGGNLISGNGIGITGNVVTSTIAGNLIGTDISGRGAIGNGYGIFLGATGTTIGGTTAASRNVITSSGLISRGGTGLELSGDRNTVQGNYIGVAGDGVGALPNQVGMALHVTNSTIGGTTPGAGNVVAGNTGAGITLDNNAGNRLLGNRIGTTATAALGNGGNGISVLLTAPTGTTPTTPLALNTTIGGTSAGEANVIANNAGAGVAVTNNYGPYAGLAIRGNQIGGNGQLGISLGGISPDFPAPGTLTITSATSTPTTSTVFGIIGGNPGQTYQVDVFNNTTVDPSGYGEGQIYLGTVAVVVGPGGLASFSQTFATPIGSRPIVTATATDLLGSTSEFAAAVPNNLAPSNLGITQTVSPPSVVIDGIITFTATITNTGSTTARNVIFTDSLPLGLNNATITTTVGTTTLDSNSVAVVRLGDLAPGASATVTISANTAANGSFSNTAGILGTTLDSTYSNNLSTQTFTVGPAAPPSADLGITVTSSTTTPALGANLTYTVTVTNGGTSAATNVTVNDFLPTGATLVNASPSQGGAATVRGTLVSSNLGTIAAGGSATLTVTITPTTGGTLVNAVNVAGNQRDPAPGNNSATSTLTVNATSTGTPALALTQTLVPTVGTIGQIQVFTLTVRNVGTAAASDVILVDSLPTGVTFVSAGSSQGSPATFANNVVTSNLGTIAAGATATFTLTVVPNSFSTGQVNLAGVVATGASPTLPVFSQAVLNVPNGPSVAAVTGSRSNGQLNVTFSAPITPASATTRANYRLYDLGLSPRAVTANDRPIAITTAVYNAQTNSVSLTPSRAVRASRYYALVVVGNTRTGITDTSGRRLVGTVGGAAGSNYTTTFFAGTLPQV